MSKTQKNPFAVLMDLTDEKPQHVPNKKPRQKNKQRNKPTKITQTSYHPPLPPLDDTYQEDRDSKTDLIRSQTPNVQDKSDTVLVHVPVRVTVTVSVPVLVSVPRNPASDRELLRQKCLETFREDKVVTRPFASADILQQQKLIPSATTCWGMLEALVDIEKRSHHLGPKDVYVLGPRYITTGRPHRPGGDTQVGGTGKAATMYNPETDEFVYETFMDAACNEIEEEFRIRASRIKCVSEHITETWSKTKNRYEETKTRVYTTRVSDCTIVPDFDPDVFGKKDRRGKDDYCSRVGFIPWGTLDECLDILSALKVCPKPDHFVDSIDAVSIIPIKTATQMARYADGSLRGKVLERAYFS